jgi:AAA15 family ATPase/GTPase
MNIEKFRIWNYKSIVDSHICYPDTRVTILAGKNEAGKTSILEALEDFNSERNISEKAIPIHGGTGNPKICVWFKVPVEEITEILGKIGHTLKVNEETIIELVKDYPNTFTLGNETIEILELTKKQAVNPETLKAEATEYLERIAAIFATQDH